MIKDYEEARDVLSDTIMTAYEQFETVKEPDSFIYFLFTLARRKYKRGLWRRRIFNAYDDSFSETIEGTGPSPAASIDARLLHDALAKLPSKQREAVTLFELADLTLDEIARIQGSKLSAVKQRVRRGRFRLGQLLGAPTFSIQEKKTVNDTNEQMICIEIETELDQR